VHKYLNYILTIKNTDITKNGIPHLPLAKFMKSDINIPSLENQQKLIKQIEDLEKEQSHIKNIIATLQKSIDSALTTIKNMKMEPEKVYTSYPLSSFATIEQGNNLTETSPTATKEFKYPYYTSTETRYCKTSMYHGDHILLTRVETNQGTVQLVQGDFTACRDFYVIKMQDDFESYYDTVKEQLEQYDFKDLIEKDPIKVTIKGKEQLSKNIESRHLEEFMVKIAEPEEQNDETNEKNDEAKEQNKDDNTVSEEEISNEEPENEPEEKPKEIKQQKVTLNSKAQNKAKEVNKKVAHKKKNITIV